MKDAFKLTTSKLFPILCGVILIHVSTATSLNLTTFKVCGVSPRPVSPFKLHRAGPREEEWSKPYHIAQDLKLYRQARCAEIIQGTSFSPKNTFASNNGFVFAAVEAYNKHHHLVLRPDDIWMAIMTQFSFYINAHAEQFRGKFVNFEGKKELSVKVGGTLRTVSYARLVRAMEAEIHKNLVDDEVRGWIMPNFTTTTENDRVSSGVVFMATMKKYFTYKFNLLCGIPTVSLDGNLDDWRNLRKRLDKLSSYGLTQWVNTLRPILDHFIRAKAGHPDPAFWARIVNSRGGGSGPTYLSGWITAFCFFNKDGERLGRMSGRSEWPEIDTNHIPSGVVEVDVTVNDNGKEHKTVMLAGSMAQEIGSDGMTLQPRSGWIIAFKEESSENSDILNPFTGWKGGRGKH